MRLNTVVKALNEGDFTHAKQLEICGKYLLIKQPILMGISEN